jgi:hypothetical protein
LSGDSVSSTAGDAITADMCGPPHLYALVAQKSAPIAAMSTGPCAVACTPST